MATENKKILIRRGSGDIPSDVQQGELLLKTDTDGIAANKVFIGTGTGTSKAIANLTDMGVEATSTELNYVRNASSNIQSQINSLGNSKAPKNNPTFTGTVTLPATNSEGNDTDAATKGYVDGRFTTLLGGVSEELDTLQEIKTLKADLASPTFTGTPKAPHPSTGDSTEQIATTQYVQGAITDITTGSVGFSVSVNEINTLDEIDTSTTVQAQLDLKAPLASPVFTGTPQLTVVDGETSTDVNLATESYVDGEISTLKGSVGESLDTLQEIETELALKATIASPVFTGTPQLTVSGTDVNLATEPYVTNQIDTLKGSVSESLDTLQEIETLLAPKASPTFTGTVTVPTPTAGDNSTAAATTAFVQNEFAPLESPTFTGTVTLPSTGSGATEAATKGYVDGEIDTLQGSVSTSLDTLEKIETLLAPKASPTFTGTVILPATGTGGSEATTKTYVDDALALKADLAGPNFSGTPTISNNNIATESYVTTAISTKANLASPVFTGTPEAPTNSTVSDSSEQIATNEFVQNAIAASTGLNSQVSATAAQINTLSGIDTNTTVQTQLDGISGSLEWTFVQKITESDNEFDITNSSLTNENFDIANYDYKFVFVLDTNAEDNSAPFIRLNNSSLSVYNYLRERVILDAVTNPDEGVNESYGGYDQNNISTGLLLPTDNANISLTNLNIEFVVSQSNVAYTYSNVTSYALMVDGRGSALAVDAPITGPQVWPVVSRFTGSVLSNSGLTQVSLIHNLTGNTGSTSNASVRIYKRAK